MNTEIGSHVNMERKTCALFTREVPRSATQAAATAVRWSATGGGQRTGGALILKYTARS